MILLRFRIHRFQGSGFKGIRFSVPGFRVGIVLDLFEPLNVEPMNPEPWNL
jgi:hypothetical protein